ncbi:aromatic acid exporter family protein [Barrientosiimonas marina]|uniref:Aromatic acid exporter family protein n=1 Tax=Lentibacillus kimchii TaxID=1542911 RepID=A0ABW2UVN3_9BACI
MKVFKHFKLVGNRIVKTGLSIFITAWICVLLDWPPVFAVITAIVTLEPTVTNSIQKGLIRFPASAIGSAYAVLFISLFGNSPITYTLAAVFTIATCVRLKLHTGLFVATLTSVAMVEVIHTNILVAFFIRLGTTTVGLIVSTVVNLFVLPPDYTKAITKKLRAIEHTTAVTIEKSFAGIFRQDNQDDTIEQELYDQLADTIQQTETLARFQREETRYHPLVGKEKTEFQRLQYQLIRLQQIHYHIGNLNYSVFKNTKFTASEQRIILDAAYSLARSLKQRITYDEAVHKGYLNQLTDIFWADSEDMAKSKQTPNRFPPDVIMLYELVSIYNLVERYYNNLS